MKNRISTTMRKSINAIIGLLIFAFSTSVSAQNTVVDVIVNSPDHDTLESAVVAADLVETLNGTGPFTVFAPTDDAFAALPDGTLDDLLADPSGDLTDILLHHVVEAEALSTSLSDGQIVKSVFGQNIIVTITGEGVFINDAQVTVADIDADNGVVHVIDAVLLPELRDIVEIVIDSEDHDTLEAAVVAAGLVETLQGDGPFTVFAPTDAAFAALPEGTLETLLDDPTGDLTKILLYHVVAGKAMSTDLSDGQMIETVFGDSIMVTITNDGVFINDAQVTVADIEATNGVIHIIDAVLLPDLRPETVVDIIVDSPDHDTLAAAVTAAGLVETLQGEGPFTVFAPTDDAFAALPEGTLETLLDDPTGDLTSILLHHVVAGKAMSTDLSDGQVIKTVFGQNIMVSITNEGVFINDAKVTVADIEAKNGVVHVIDAVLLPELRDIVEIVIESEDHDTLEAAVVAAGLVETLQGEGPFTVFAPTDDAFAALPEGTLETLLDDPTGDLTSILLHHVVAGKAMSTDLSDGQVIETVFGQNITLSITNDGVFINDAQVTVADIEATNGVIHVIDAVLLPELRDIVEIVIESEDHETLEAAVVAAGLVETLQGEGPFTVFAPTDAAFAALPEGTLDALLDDPTGDLTDILLYHVVAGKAMSTDLSDGQIIETVLGKNIMVTITNDGVFINDAQVTVADIEASNGVIHVIDAVLLPPNDIQVMENEQYGKILTDHAGNTLYFFTKDAYDTSACINGCLDNWPVFYEEDPSLDAELDATDFGSIDRGDGVMQTTYKGWPLYYFANDENPGDTNGEAVINAWFVAKPDYTIMLVDNQLTGNDGKNYKGDYTEGDEVIQYFTDGMGLTLYTWINDNYLVNNFTNEDFSNDNIWPIYEEDTIIVPSTLDPSNFAFVDVYGKSQLAYNGWPLYYFGQDDMMRGSNKGVSVPAPGVWPVAVQDIMPAPYSSVVDIVVNSEDHETLEAAVIAADLVETLNGDGPFTVFAPTDDAFAALPEGTLNDLLADPSGALTDILLYHVVNAKAMSTDLSDGQKIETVLGDSIMVSITNEGVFINDAQVTVADIEADNGVVHVIDAVLTPPTNTVVDIIVNSADHDTLEAAVIAADLVETLNGEGPFTVFAPTDDAFAALPEGTLDDLLADPSGALTDILLYHVVNAKAMSTDLSDGQEIETVLGENILVSITNEGIFINDAQVTVADIEADNGVVHVIDAVLTPPTSVNDRMIQEEMINIYPNPASEQFTIQVINTDRFANGTAEIVRIDGVIVKTIEINATTSIIDLSEFESGVYFVRYTKDRNYSLDRLIIQK